MKKMKKNLFIEKMKNFYKKGLKMHFYCQTVRIGQFELESPFLRHFTVSLLSVTVRIFAKNEDSELESPFYCQNFNFDLIIILK